MKKINISLVLAASLALVACESESEQLPGGEPLEEIEENCGPEYPNAEPCK